MTKTDVPLDSYVRVLAELLERMIENYKKQPGNSELLDNIRSVLDQIMGDHGVTRRMAFDKKARKRYAETQKLPGIVFIPVDEQGNNQIFVLPGVGDDFSAADVERATPLFEEAGKKDGTLIITLECPLHTAAYAVELANKHNLKVMFDPGGIEPETDVTRIIQAGVYLIKPNEHEAKLLTGIDVTDFASATQAAEKLHNQGIENVLITAGAAGAYLFTKDTQKHIPIPDVKGGSEKDETGCGDQTMAALCAALQDGKPLEQAAELAIRAGTMQFYRHGIKPVKREELA